MTDEITSPRSRPPVAAGAPAVGERQPADHRPRVAPSSIVVRTCPSREPARPRAPRSATAPRLHTEKRPPPCLTAQLQRRACHHVLAPQAHPAQSEAVGDPASAHPPRRRPTPDAELRRQRRGRAGLFHNVRDEIQTSTPPPSAGFVAGPARGAHLARRHSSRHEEEIRDHGAEPAALEGDLV